MHNLNDWVGLFLILVVLGIIAAGALEWAWSAWDAPGPAAPSGNETVILVPAHSRTHDIAQLLEQVGGPLDVGEEERDGTHREVVHTESPSLWSEETHSQYSAQCYVGR